MLGPNLAKTLTATVVGIALAVAGTLGAEARTLDEIISSGTIRIATGTDFPPYDTVDKNMDPAGYDTDIANMIANDLGVKLELQVTIAGNRVSRNGRLAFAVACIKAGSRRLPPVRLYIHVKTKAPDTVKTVRSTTPPP